MVSSCPSSKKISNIQHISTPKITICIHFQLLEKITRENCRGIQLAGEEHPVYEGPQDPCQPVLDQQTPCCAGVPPQISARHQKQTINTRYTYQCVSDLPKSTLYLTGHTEY